MNTMALLRDLARALDYAFDRVFLLLLAFAGWMVAGALFIVLEVVVPRVCG